MANFIPTFKLYQSDGSTLVYTFTKMQNINDFQDPSSYIEHTSLRGIGSIIVPDSNTQADNGNTPWDLNMSFYFIGSDYEDLVSQMDTLKTTVKKFTKYVLKVQKTQAGATQDYKVQRLSQIDFPISGKGRKRRKRVTLQLVNLSLRVNAWQ